MQGSPHMWLLAGRYSAVGIEMAAAVAIGAFGGRWLDRLLNTSPYGVWFGLVVGLGAASLTVWRLIRHTHLSQIREPDPSHQRNNRK